MKVIITNEAWQRLEKELSFLIESHSITESKALTIGRKLLKRAKTLSEQPFKGQEEPYLVELSQGHRRIIEGNFKIVYYIDNESVYVVNFFNTRRDPGNLKG